jgi:hypothetical protein
VVVAVAVTAAFLAVLAVTATNSSRSLMPPMAASQMTGKYETRTATVIRMAATWTGSQMRGRSVRVTPSMVDAPPWNLRQRKARAKKARERKSRLVKRRHAAEGLRRRRRVSEAAATP